MGMSGLSLDRAHCASRPMKRPDGGVVLGKELRMPDKHARAIPQLEAFEKVLGKTAHEPLQPPLH
jgi:hypothetical protein